MSVCVGIREIEGIDVEGLTEVVGSTDGSVVVGLNEGSSVGTSVGYFEGNFVGIKDGFLDGTEVGPALGKQVGRSDIVG